MKLRFTNDRDTIIPRYLRIIFRRNNRTRKHNLESDDAMAARNRLMTQYDSSSSSRNTLENFDSCVCVLLLLSLRAQHPRKLSCIESLYVPVGFAPLERFPQFFILSNSVEYDYLCGNTCFESGPLVR